MATLVGYASSDDEDDIQPEKPAKISTLQNGAKTALWTSTGGAEKQSTRSAADSVPSALPSTPPVEPPPAEEEAIGPAPGPGIYAASPITSPAAIPQPDASAPASPYTTERQRIRELTMPPIPNFNNPDSPPPPPMNSEEAARLAATTKKFERFLELKKQGVHFNDRLQSSTSLRNPSLLPKLMEFAVISQEDSYASMLPEEVDVPRKWPEECYVENLIRQNERREKKRLAEREKVEFVPAAQKSGTSSVDGTPGSTAGGGKKRKSRFDQR